MRSPPTLPPPQNLECALYLNILLSSYKMYITINNIKGEKKLTYLIQFKILTQARKLQLSECLAIMLNTR